MDGIATGSKLKNFRCVVPMLPLATEAADASTGVGMLYRSGAPDDIDEATANHLTEKLGIKTIIDLRSVRNTKDCGSDAVKAAFKNCTYDEYRLEMRSNSNAAINGRYHIFMPVASPRYILSLLGRLPISKYPHAISCLFSYAIGSYPTAVRDLAATVVLPYGQAQQYFDFLQTGHQLVSDIVTLLSDPNRTPALICCQHGKDRTGCIVAITLHALGYTFEDIVNDYETSQTMIGDFEPIRKEMYEAWGLDDTFVYPTKDKIITMFDKLVQRYGSADAYLDSAGVTVQVRERLKTALLKHSTESQKTTK